MLYYRKLNSSRYLFSAVKFEQKIQDRSSINQVSEIRGLIKIMREEIYPRICAYMKEMKKRKKGEEGFIHESHESARIRRKKEFLQAADRRPVKGFRWRTEGYILR